jgi:hypothetical protein
MKKTKILLLILTSLLLVGCTQHIIPTNNNNNITIQDMILNQEELLQLGIQTNEPECKVEHYETSELSPLAEYAMCNYTIIKRNATQIIVQLQTFSNFNDLNGSYQYNSLHLRGFQGLINENEYGNLSRFYVNNESNTYYYHFWIVSEPHLIHVTSKGIQDDKDYVKNITLKLVSKARE